MVESGWDCTSRTGCVRKIGPNEGFGEFLLVHVKDVRSNVNEMWEGGDVWRL